MLDYEDNQAQQYGLARPEYSRSELDYRLLYIWERADPIENRTSHWTNSSCGALETFIGPVDVER